MHTEIGNRENEEIDIQTQAKARKNLLIIMQSPSGFLTFNTLDFFYSAF